jgi:hypothetical protein
MDVTPGAEPAQNSTPRIMKIDVSITVIIVDLTISSRVGISSLTAVHTDLGFVDSFVRHLKVAFSLTSY